MDAGDATAFDVLPAFYMAVALTTLVAARLPSR
jgi:hypothetical protein